MKTYSTKPAAVSFRISRLLKDEVADKHNARSKAYSRLKRAAKIVRQTEERESLRTTDQTKRSGTFAKHWLATVARHLSKGRDAGQIAVRENVRVAKVLEAIATLKAQGLTPPQPQS